VLVAVALTTLLGLALTRVWASPVSLASTTTVSISSALLTAGGVNVSIGYSCAPGAYAYGPFSSVTVVQGSVSRSTSLSPTCDNNSRSATVLVAGPFSAKGATVNAMVCGLDCGFASVTFKHLHRQR
jgi:hypothetical protein